MRQLAFPLSSSRLGSYLSGPCRPPCHRRGIVEPQRSGFTLRPRAPGGGEASSDSGSCAVPGRYGRTEGSQARPLRHVPKTCAPRATRLSRARYVTIRAGQKLRFARLGFLTAHRRTRVAWVASLDRLSSCPLTLSPRKRAWPRSPSAACEPTCTGRLDRLGAMVPSWWWGVCLP
jgi:hypothetical protein